MAKLFLNDMEINQPPNGSICLMMALKCVDLELKKFVQKKRLMFSADPQFQGLYVSEEELDEILAETMNLPKWKDDENEPVEEDQKADELRNRRDLSKREIQFREHCNMRLNNLRNTYSLDVLELNILLLCVIQEIDLRYEKVFGYLNDDITKRRPSVDLILNIFAHSIEEKLIIKELLQEPSRLVSNRIINVYEDASKDRSPFIGKYVTVDPSIVSYLFGVDQFEDQIQPFVSIHYDSSIDSLIALPVEAKSVVESIAQCSDEKLNSLLLNLIGDNGVPHETIARKVCSEIGRDLLFIDFSKRKVESIDEFRDLLFLLGRHCKIKNEVVFIRSQDIFLTDENTFFSSTFWENTNQFECPVILSSRSAIADDIKLTSRIIINLTLEPLSYQKRKELWENLSKLHGLEFPEKLIADLALTFHFDAGKIVNVARSIANHTLLFGKKSCPQHQKMLAFGACRSQTGHTLHRHAQKVVSHHTWKDLVLPIDKNLQLQEITSNYRYRSIVYEDWGFKQKLSLGKGLNALFCGGPGTGKTLAASIIANDLKLELYKIDLSNIISKYIGETEKNLAKVFSEAAISEAILFFDEADAIFGKRSEVKDSHDRYANIETSYLLQKMEEYEGIVILATNLRKNLDDAFTRRMHFTVEFPFPRVEERYRIWSQIWPEALPKEDDIDFAYLARELELTGGNIKNIALAASFFAAAEQQIVSMSAIMRAAKREYQKIGKINIPNGGYWKSMSDSNEGEKLVENLV